MEYQKIIKLLDNTPNQLCKVRTKNWVEINDGARGTHNINSQTEFKTSVLKSNLRDYGDVNIAVNATITVPNAGTAAAPNDRNSIKKKSSI